MVETQTTEPGSGRISVGAQVPSNVPETGGPDLPNDDIVIQYLRDGKVDAEIAVRLGTSITEARNRIDAARRRQSHVSPALGPTSVDAVEPVNELSRARGGLKVPAPFAVLGGVLVVSLAAVMVLVLAGLPVASPWSSGPSSSGTPAAGAGSKRPVSASTPVYAPAEPPILAIIGPAIGARIAAGLPPSDSRIPSGN